ncbi:hypothetical protein KCU91_g29, partial [Aureobasidium melanogenum]
MQLCILIAYNNSCISIWRTEQSEDDYWVRDPDQANFNICDLGVSIEVGITMSDGAENWVAAVVNFFDRSWYSFRL